MTATASLTVDTLGSATQRERHQRILDVTLELATAGGYDAVQMREVADRAGVAMGTLYRYFPSKLHLLVSCLARELERSNARLDRRPVSGGTAADRVAHVLDKMTQGLRRDPHLTEALTRAFMFADASVAAEIAVVEGHVSHLLLHAMAGPEPDPEAGTGPGTAPGGEAQRDVAKVIGDVWLASLVQWVTGRTSAEDVSRSLDVAVRLLLSGSR
ncbi:TetR family transcriptional regulator [Nocardioides mesophilus]|uniref:TetR family transcriptional regulator n=1 Tax=Nocardioides mesophilus TaxID=433659 RepID=UPI001FE43D70|nr:TetR family transcriptional regulator [Nocardioides mesophilus]